VFLGFSLVQSVGLYRLTRETKAFVHPIVKLFTFSLFFQLLSVLAEAIHYLVYSFDGKGVLPLDKFSEGMEALGRVAFILLLILLAKGWTISTDELRYRGFLIVGMLALFFAYFSLIIFDWAARDPESTLYEYESVPGALIVSLNGLTGIWFVVTILFTWRAEDDQVKKNFLLQLGLIYTVWFAVLPVMVLLGLGLDPWVREKIVKSMNLTITTLAFFILGYLLWPSRSDAYFRIKTPNVTQSTHNAYEQL